MPISGGISRGGDYVYQVQLDDSDVLDALQKIETAIEGLGKRGSKGVDQVGASATKMGLTFGIVNQAVDKLTDAVLEMGKRAVQAIGDVIQQGVGLASQMETNRIAFKNIFTGGPGGLSEALGLRSADVLMQRILDLSVDLGANFADISGLARTLLPQLGSIEQFERLATSAVLLARADPERTVDDARRALENFSEGTAAGAVSLERLFDIPKRESRKMQKALQESGIDGWLDSLEDFLKRTGRDVESFERTFQVALGRLDANWQQLVFQLGQPILAPLLEDLNLINDWIGENREELGLAAQAWGEVFARALELLTPLDSIEDFDAKKLTDAADDAYEFVESMRVTVTTLWELLTVLAEVKTSLSVTGQLFGESSSELPTFSEGLQNIQKNLIILTAWLTGVSAGLSEMKEQVSDFAKASLLVTSGEYGQALDVLANSWNNLKDGVYDAEKAQRVAQETADRLMATYNEGQENIEAQQQKHEELRKEFGLFDEEAYNAGNAALAEADAAKKAADALAEYEAAQTKVNEAVDKARRSRSEKLIDNQIRLVRDLAKAEEKALAARLKQERANADKIEDIYRDHQHRIDELGEDLSDDEERRALEDAQKRVEVERDTANRRIEILLAYQRRKQAIELEFDRAATAAARERSVVDLLAAQEARDQAIQDAQTDRDQELTDNQTDGQRRKAELEQQRQEELELDKLANQQKLDELDRRLAYELEKQRTANERAIREQEIKDQAAAEQARNAAALREQDINLAFARELQELTRKYKAELDIMREYEKQKTQLAVDEAKKRIEEVQAIMNSVAMAPFGSGSSSNSNRGSSGGVFHEGGVIPGPVGAPRRVSALGGETILPTHRPQYQPAGAALARSIDNSRTIEMGDVTLGGGTPGEMYLSLQEFLGILRRTNRR